jgi:tetratricopeptide (TPR) repeat protein
MSEAVMGRKVKSPFRYFGIVLCVVAISPPRATGQEAPTELTPAAYGELVLLYRSGKYGEAARRLAEASDGEIEIAVDAYRRKPLTEADIKAAIMLHTETLMRSDVESSFHMQTARNWMRELDGNRRQPFEKLWYLAVCYHYMRMLSPAAQAALQTAAHAFPDDVDVGLALGSFDEMTGWTQKDERYLKRAEYIYRRILETFPASAETLVRLGRTLFLMGDDNEAQSLLKEGLESTHVPRLELAAHLTLGDLHRKRHQLAQAIESYRAAVELDPLCQSAVVALALALHKAGDPEASLEVIERYFKALPRRRESTSSSEEPDLWWRYVLGHSDEYGFLLLELRREVKP